MGWGPRAVLAVCALCAPPACTVLQSGPDPDAPTPWLWGIESRAGVSSIHEDLPAEVDTPGTAAGFQAFAAYQPARHFAGGLAVDAAVGFHGDGLYPIFALALLGRSELPYVSLSGWASWYVGNRLIDEDSDDLAESGLQLQGPGAGLAALWRLELRHARVLELGPFVQSLWLHSTDDDSATVENENGAGVHVLAAGLTAQFVFGGVR
ncbi:MAG TPA: hypothetical protein VFU21_27580 [Kofleriaceae bacterium]|nr:hypothetical protein [Kofleriaceae bacterium]